MNDWKPADEPTLYIGKKPFWIGFVGIDKKTGEAKTKIASKPVQDPHLMRKRTDNFAEGFGLMPKEKCGILAGATQPSHEMAER